MNKFMQFCFFCLLTAGTVTLSAQTTAATEVSSIETAVVKVKGATCKTDLGMIVDNIKKTEGVSACEILKHGAVTSLEVKYNPAAVTLEKVQTVIESTGTCSNPNERRYSVRL